MLDSVREFAAEQADDLAAVRAPPRRVLPRPTPSGRCSGGARTGGRGSPGSRASAGTCGSRSSACCAAGEAEDALRIAIAFARALPWDAHAHEVRGWLAQALEAYSARSRARCAPPRCTGTAQLALSQARFEAGRGAARAGARRRAGRSGDAALEAAALDRARAPRGADRRAGRARACARRRSTLARRVGDPGLLADALLALRGRVRALRGLGARGRARPTRRSRSTARPAISTASPSALGEQGFYDIVHGRLERAEQRLGEALELRRQLGDDRRLVEPLIDNAWLDLARGSAEAARRGFLDCLALGAPRRRSVQRRRGARRASRAWPPTTASTSRPSRLAGASAAIHERIGAPPWESVTAIHERALAAARDALGADAFAALHSEGRRLSPEQAVARTTRTARPSAIAR